MKKLKLIAKPNTWFKEGTEVFDYDSFYPNYKRISLEDFNRDWKDSGLICIRGTRISKSEHELVSIGTEYEDGESCSLEEFDMEIIEE